MQEVTIVRSVKEATLVTTPWGSLTWYASGALGNAGGLTVGKCTIKPGMENPLHRHPDCAEVLTVLQGTIMHTSATGEVRMEVGDTITVSAGFTHQARNIGATDAILFVTFPTPDRKVENE